MTTTDSEKQNGSTEAKSAAGEDSPALPGSGFCECMNWCRDGRDMFSPHHPRCQHYVPPPADPRYARFGEAMWKYIVNLGGDFCGDEISEDILPLAQAAGLCCRAKYDPAIHGENIEAEPGDEIWWWGEPLHSQNAEMSHEPGENSMDTTPQKPSENGQPGSLRSGDLFGEIVRKHNLAVESLTEQKLAEVIRQAIASGDIMRHVMHDGSAQAITYIPYREVFRLRDQYHELLYAVASKHEGETRHETALRYIREREERTEGPCSSSPNAEVSDR